MSRLFAPTLLAAAVTLGLTACGPSEEERRQAAEQAARQAAEAQATEQLALYEQALAEENWEIAETYGRFLRESFPDTDATRSIDDTYGDVTERAGVMREQRRLEDLWVYHQVEEDGAQTATAYIYSVNGERGVAPVRLVLRSHAEWGTSAYLLPDGETPRFACANPCDIQVTFDGDTRSFEAMVSEPTENHALFIEDHDRFLDALDDAGSVSLEVGTEGGGTVSLDYEVGGFDRSRYLGD
ncbi:MAG: hypothetical protein ACXIUZ_10065 [Lysobacteraceae bacterium]